MSGRISVQRPMWMDATIAADTGRSPIRVSGVFVVRVTTQLANRKKGKKVMQQVNADRALSVGEMTLLESLKQLRDPGIFLGGLAYPGRHPDLGALIVPAGDGSYRLSLESPAPALA